MMDFGTAEMRNEQIIAIAAPMAFNGAIIGLMVLWMKVKFEGIDSRSNAINQRFDDMRELWRAELHRVEEVLDARLKHLEQS